MERFVLPRLHYWKMFFLLLALLRRASFLTTFYGLYFNSSYILQITHITHIQDVHNIAGPMVPYNMHAPSGDWSTKIGRVLLSDHCSTSKPPRLDIIEKCRGKLYNMVLSELCLQGRTKGALGSGETLRGRQIGHF